MILDHQKPGSIPSEEKTKQARIGSEAGKRRPGQQDELQKSEIGNFGTDVSKIGSLLGISDRYFHGNSSFFRRPVFISALSSLILPFQPYWFLSACSYPFSGHHIGTLAPLSSPFASPVPNPKGFHCWLSRRYSAASNQPPLKILLKHWASDT